MYQIPIVALVSSSKDEDLRHKEMRIRLYQRVFFLVLALERVIRRDGLLVVAATSGTGAPSVCAFLMMVIVGGSQFGMDKRPSRLESRVLKDARRELCAFTERCMRSVTST